MLNALGPLPPPSLPRGGPRSGPALHPTEAALAFSLWHHGTSSDVGGFWPGVVRWVRRGVAGPECIIGTRAVFFRQISEWHTGDVAFHFVVHLWHFHAVVL